MALRNHLGVNIHQANDAERLSAAASLGCQYWRADWNWYDINPSPDVWRWDYFDAMVDAAQQHGCSIAATLGGTPDWANGGLGRHVPPTHIMYWEAFVTAVVQRYQGRIAAYLLWNEPNRGYWTGTVGQYVEYIVMPAVRLIKSIDPTAVVAAPELSTEGAWEDWLRSFLLTAGELLDVITVHAYADTGAQVWDKLTRPRLWYEVWKKRSVKQVIEQAGYLKKPCWVTETGWQSSQVGEDGQAARWRGLLERLQANAWPSGICAYALVDEPTNSWGFFREDHSAKPSALVLRNYAEQLIG